ncbi:MAG TPA: cardiolipin synthase ClsB [Polyangium sp.]|nr:cardiolipin synthase ClsB [Polyangium sp.]
MFERSRAVKPATSPGIDARPALEVLAGPSPTRESGAYCDVVVGFHRLRLLKDGTQAFPAMLEAIKNARATICLETYILEDDRIGQLFADALIERARGGVEVNLLYDTWGSSVSSGFVDRLIENGVRVLPFRPVLHVLQDVKMVRQVSRRNHRKALIVDSSVAFTGGINISNDYASRDEGGGGFRDTHLEFEGPAALELQYFFLRTWKKANGAVIDDARYSHQGRRPDPFVHVVTNDMHRGRSTIRHAYRKAIHEAKRRIYVTNAYFLPTLGVLRGLCDAAKRGVDVRVMVAGTTDVTAVKLATRTIYGRMLHAGIRLYEWHGRVLHAKTAVIDGHWSTVGSSNLDQQSLRMNMEANAIIEDARFARAMEKMFHEDLEHCEAVTTESWHQRPAWERAASWAAYLFRDWL